MKNIDLKNKVISLYKEGLSGLKIKEQIDGYSLARIYQILRSEKITRSFSESDKLKFINRYPNVTKELLYDLYIIKQLTIPKIASEIKVRKDITRRLLLLYNITLRTTKEHLAIPKHRQTLKDAISKVANTTKFRLMVSKNSKKMWSDRNYKIPYKQLEIMNTKEYKIKMRKIMLDRHRSEWHDKIKPLISNGLYKLWSENQQYRDKILSKLREMREKSYEQLHEWRESIKDHVEAGTYSQFRENLIKSTKMETRMSFCISKQQVILYNLLKNLDINFIPEYNIGHYLFDCFLPDYNILIEVNGDYWHNQPKTIRNDKAKSTYIEKYFPQYQLKYLWEHEFKCINRISDLLQYWTNKGQTIDFKFNDINAREIDYLSTKFFLEKFHYISKIGNNSIKLGFELNDKLIGVITYGHIVRNETATRLNLNSNQILELSRLCIHPAYQKKNFASWMISKSIGFVKTHPNIKLLVSFADTTFNHSGTIYKASNWTLDGVVKPSYWYVDKDGYVMHKKTLWDHAMSLKLSEKVFAEKYGYTKINGKEKLRFIYHLD